MYHKVPSLLHCDVKQLTYLEGKSQREPKHVSKAKISSLERVVWRVRLYTVKCLAPLSGHWSRKLLSNQS